MARGQKCPKCGKLTFHPEGPVRECSSCGVTGWLGTGPTTTARRGKKCGFCGIGTMKQVGATENGAQLHYCFTCSATYTDSN